MRRTLTILAVLIVILGIVLAVYFFYFRTTATVTVSPTGGTLPSAGQTTSSSTAVIPAVTNSPVAVSPRLVKIASGPIVPGMVIVDTPAASASSSPETIVSYIERQSGNIYTYSVQSQTTTRTSNKTVPGIQSASWLPDGSLAFVRYLTGTDFSTVNTYGLPSNGSNGFFLNQDLAGLAVSSSSVLMLASGVNGSVGLLAHTDGTSSKSVFTSPLSSLRVSFAGRGYLAFTKPSALLDGDAFLVDSSGRFSRIAGPASGLVALASPSGKWVLVSSSHDGTMQMQLINTATGEALPLPVATIADKCVWTANESAIYCGIPMNPPSASYPDDWYQGVVSFSDRLWKIDVAGRYAALVLDFSKETKTSLDATALTLDSGNTTIAFINKNDGSLWSFSL
ncbi:hypothetical protein KGM48_00560 [Patescibacteria group bacterium]|nr:hypothetical protein [Patescibacteria group bacterium]